MGINLKDIFKQDNESLVIDRKKQAMKYLVILSAVLLVVIIVLIALNNTGDLNEKRRIEITRDIRNVRSYVQNKASEYEENSETSLPGSPLENAPLALNINGIVEEYRYGYYLLNPYETDVQMNLILPNEQYIVNYDTLDVVNVSGVKYNRKVYHSYDDLVAIENRQLIPSEHTIIIKVASDMQKLYQYPDSIFKLAGNIDMSDYKDGEGWKPVSDFGGQFDGRGYTISNLTINRPTESYVGLFAQAKSTAKISNLTFKDVNIVGEDYTGVLAGTMAGNISNIIIDGGTVTGTNRVGGLVGAHQGTISKCKVDLRTVAGENQVGGAIGLLYTGTVGKVIARVTNVNGVRDVGGFVGSVSATNATYLVENGAISTVSGTGNLGGFMGQVEILASSKLEFRNCYSNGTISTGTENIGGLAGRIYTSSGASIIFDDLYAAVTILNKVATAGGCVGYSDLSTGSPSTATDVFWEKNLAVGEVLNSVGTISPSSTIISFSDKNSNEMRLRVTFANWDFDTWQINEYRDTPRLRFEDTFKTYSIDIITKK